MMQGAAAQFRRLPAMGRNFRFTSRSILPDQYMV